jgi:hypothetical protein
VGFQSHCIAAIAAAFFFLAPAAVLAQDPTAVPDERAERARAEFDRGVLLSQEERWAEALEAFRESRALVERPSTVFNIATALQRLGRDRDAIDAVDAFLAIADPMRDGAQIDQARTLRGVLRETVAEITLRLRPGTADVSVDARASAPRGDESDVRVLELDPGEHVVEVRAPGYRPSAVTITLASGEHVTREIALEHIESTPAELSVHASRSDARIVVDEQTVGTGSAEIELVTGTHLVRVEAPEHRTFQRIVDLGPAEQLAIEAPLERISGGSIFEEPAFWAVTGSVVVAGIVAGVLVAVLVPSSPGGGYGGSGGFTIELAVASRARRLTRSW